jgi:penicillin-binding protein 2
MASAPTYNPNIYAERHDALFWAQQRDYLDDTNAKPQINRAMQENYAPGSIFKIVTGMAGLENGTLHPEEIFHSLGYFRMPGLAHPIGDTAKEGDFDFDRALAKSSNPYFITNGLKPGVLQKIIALGQRLHLGERTGLIKGQEAPGHLPTPHDIASSSWYRVDTAYLSIGQGPIAVTPLQMAVMVAAVANGGKVLQPRLVARVEPYGSVEPEAQLRAPAQVRDTLGVSQRTLQIVRHAMRKDVESPEGSGHDTDIPGFAIAGKTGTAEVEKHGHKDSEFKDTWFVSFAPFDNPRYVVLAMVEGGRSGAKTCVPVVHKVYQAILQREKQREQKPKKLGTLAEMQ